jgi:hypothetical protein
LWVTETAGAFWDLAGDPEPFPRNLRLPIAYALPLTVALLPRLRVAAVDAWLRRRGVTCAPAVADRPLRACLVARDGQGFVFMDGTDPEDEQRFSLAHELAHFLRDYWRRRREAVARLGPAVADVLDGERPPNQDERIHALLTRMRLGSYVHLMDRAPDGQLASAPIDLAERNADRLGFELLAPAEIVLAPPLPEGVDACRSVVQDRLVRNYGLPAAAAVRYVAILVPDQRPTESLLYRLGLVQT